MRVEALLEQNAAEHGANGAVERRDGHDDAGVARGGRRVERDHVGDGRERPSNGGAQHHDAAGLGRDGFAQVAELAVLGAHNERPQAAEQVVEACCECGKGKGDGERA